MDADLCQKDATSGSVRKGAAVNEGSRCFPAERPLVCAEVLGWARAWSTRLSPALPPDPIPADPAETFEPLQSGAPFKMCAFPTNFQAFLQTEHSGYCKTKSKSLGYPWDLLSPLWVIPAGSPDLRAALPAPGQAGNPFPRPGLQQLHPCRAAPGHREEDQSCAVSSRAHPDLPHLQHIWPAVSRGLKRQLSLSVGEHSRNNPASLP